MDLHLKINKIPLYLGQSLPPEAVVGASRQRTGLWRRWGRKLPARQVYAIEDCELEGFGDELHIYPCTHSYLNRDRQWHTRVTLFLECDRLHRILFQVVEGQTAALNFLERFEAAAARAIGEPAMRDPRTAMWLGNGARLRTYLHPDRVNADIDFELDS